MVKFGQAFMMVFDDEMISKSDKIPTSVQASNLIEELGQIQYIFSDKTGTLTKNIMEFKNITLNGTSYGEDRSYKAPLDSLKITNVDFRDQNFFEDMKNAKATNYWDIR